MPDLTNSARRQLERWRVHAETEGFHERLDGAPAERGNEIGACNEPRHHQEMRDTHPNAAFHFTCGEGDIHGCRGGPGLRYNDVLERDVTRKGQLPANAGMVFAYDSDIAIFEEDLLLVFRRQATIEENHEVEVPRAERLWHLVKTPRRHLK
jgi:hypothetical protein